MSIGNLNKHLETEHEIEVHWDIENFLSLLKGTLTKTSPSFSWSSENWTLETKYDSEDRVALYINRNTSGKEIKVIYKLGIRLIDGTIEMRSSIIRRFNDSSSSGGVTEVICKSELQERKCDLLQKGTLTFSCSILHFDTLIKPNHTKYESLDILSSNFKTLHGCATYSDMTIVVGEKIYPVHKNILATRSDVFLAMFQSNMEEVKSGLINVSDCDPTAFKDFLLYLYTGKVENFSSSNVCHLYRIADKYNVQELKSLCVKYMKRNVSAPNLFDIIILAKQFDETDLICLAQDVFNKNALEIVEGEDWEFFMKHNFPIANQLIKSVLQKLKTED